ncbi:MAG: 2-oxoglutarate dehydrogenase E1 component [Deinococcota bacterium]|nr:2-oxoglutarate dehydrogenase E1 component [Deinococcota bacterium]
MSLGFVEALYAQYLDDPAGVEPEWHRYFEGLAKQNGAIRARQGPSFAPSSLFHARGVSKAVPPNGEVASLQDRVVQLVRAYRVRAHMVAAVDPLGMERAEQPELEPSFYGFSEEDMARRVSSDTIPGEGAHTIGEILQRLKNTYCRSVGVQFMHIDSLGVRRWLQERMETTENRVELSRQEQLRILSLLTDAVIFEQFIQRKFIGAKSFSLEGAESLIPLLALAIDKAGEQGLDEIVLGMAHRGRLNVLANIMGKSPKKIFREFEDPDPRLHLGRGDVKYHLGYSSDWTTESGHQVHLSLCFNPSHLEFINPVALGRVRAKQDRVGDKERERGMALLIHGDAAFAGQGVLQETFNMSQLEGYRTGGTLHVVINNQIGFTTSPSEGRSTTYATDVAKMLQSPIFHVNGEDPEAVAQVVRLAMDFRAEFKRDVVIDMYSYRRHGHNEGDEPAFTQPRLYQAIRRRVPVREGYLAHLLSLGGITREEADKIEVERKEHLEGELSAARSDDYRLEREEPAGVWKGYHGGLDGEAEEVATAVEAGRLSDLLGRLTHPPEDFKPNPKIARGFKGRLEMAAGERPLDWTAGETLAFATLLTEGYPIRMTGQDTQRGTFSQRHAVLHDVADGHPYTPLQHLDLEQAPLEIYNSPLSEIGVLGFEYGYSLDYPDALVAWEAQFGDFVNAGQVIVDQFIVSAEDKWRRLSGLVLLLPHGFEGQGPEHSSARLERFLMLAAEDNIQVANLTTPAQLFHLLRRQVLRKWRKPLVVMTPKSLLRHPRAVSPLSELAEGRFQRVIPDAQDAPVEGVRRILICTGKVYYELEKEREDLGRNDVAILRLEQLYPLPEEELRAALAPYRDGTPVFWVQEEPENMGAWRFLRVKFGSALGGRLPFSGISRPESASPATGSASSHKLEQAKLLGEAFGGLLEPQSSCAEPS